MKKLILAKTNEYGYFIKNRYIAERDFDPDDNTKAKQVLFYENDKMSIQVIKTKVNYDVVIIKNNKHTIRMCSFPCYTKAREEMFKIIKELEECDIYGFIANPRIEYLECYSSDAIIEKCGLTKIY